MLDQMVWVFTSSRSYRWVWIRKCNSRFKKVIVELLWFKLMVMEAHKVTLLRVLFINNSINNKITHQWTRITTTSEKLSDLIQKSLHNHILKIIIISINWKCQFKIKTISLHPLTKLIQLLSLLFQWEIEQTKVCIIMWRLRRTMLNWEYKTR
jgi:hypothetical protein